MKTRMHSSHMPRNRMRDMRMRDGQRWVNVYREEAWDVAVEEARRRSVLGHLYYAIGYTLRMLDTSE